MSHAGTNKVVGTLALFVGISMLSSPSATAGPGTASVEVVNPATAPVPVTGTVDVGGTVNIGAMPPVALASTTLQAQQAGTWNVGIAGSPTVALAPAQPVSFALQVAMFPTFLHGQTTFTVPAGQRLVIESVHAIAGTLVPSQSYLMDVTAGPASVPSFAPPGSVMDTVTASFAPGINLQGNTYYSGASTTRMYADPGTTVMIEFFRHDDTNEEWVTVGVIGYLVPAS
jgi:hypothetical protein